ncbi:MAG TPA: FAD-dependent monooxygenase [Steroidobacteraceae bacterium]|jgi:3-(3-hydroxy-phenyl)propionate hydroxylase|nr:FAD-dependent monooxygenase [Steroidobacteraceae bacterium]
MQTMMEHAVLISGAGPTGLMLAAELALAGVDAALVERRCDQGVVGSRAMGLHARTLEVFDQRGIVERFLSQGKRHSAVMFHVPLDISDLATRHNYTLGLWQRHTERILAEWIDELGVPIYRGCELVAVSQSDAGAAGELSNGRHFKAQYVVGCDGARSLVRRSAGIDFRGSPPTTSWLIAEVAASQQPPWGFRENETGIHAIGEAENGLVRLVLVEKQLQLDNQPTLEDIREALIAIYGSDFGIHDPTWISRFTDATRQAAVYRQGRILLAGDAAHMHPPMGGRGLDLGIEDAVNLGWKLAQVLKRISSAELLDTYQAERHPVAARVLQITMAQATLRRPEVRLKAVGNVIAELLRMNDARKHMAVEMAGLAVRYDSGEGDPLLGHRMPDLEVMSGSGAVRVFTLLHAARPVLLNFQQPGAFNLSPWADRVRLIDATFDGQWHIPAVGPVAAPAAVLIRPDGYIAWTGDRRGVGLSNALETWFGAREPGTHLTGLAPPELQ